MHKLRGVLLVVIAILLTMLTGCNHFLGNGAQKIDGVSLWLLLAGGGGVLAILGIMAALVGSGESQGDGLSKRGVGLIFLGIGVVLAILGIA